MAVLIIDDHQMVAESIVRLLDDELDLAVVGVASTAEAGLRIAAECRPDVVVMDYGLPDMDGITATGVLRDTVPSAQVLLLTGAGGDDLLAAAIAGGCSGYVEKTEAFTELARAVRLAAGGEIVLPPGQLSRLLPALRRRNAGERRLAELTDREHDVLALSAEGLANKAIAKRLGLQLNTVRNHVQRILAKLDAHSKLEAVAIASRHDLLRPVPALDEPAGVRGQSR